MLFKRLVSLLLLAVLLAGCSGLSPGGQSADTIPVTGLLDEVQGTVAVRDLGQADFSPAANGAGLQVGGQIRTGSDGRARLNLSTGTMIRIGPDTLFQFQSNQPVTGGLLTHIILQAGQVWVSLSGGGVDIETPSGVASVRGSYMKVTVDPLTQDVWVNCLEGLCQAQSPSGTMDLIAGQGCLLYAWDASANISPMAPSMYHLSQQDVAEFMAVNPECHPIIPDANATASALPQLTPQFTATPLQNCFQLTAPANGAAVSADDPLTFTWTEQPGRYKYILTIIRPNGGRVSLISWTNSYTKDMSLLAEAGTYQWSVTAYDAQIRPICTAGPFTFTKPAAGDATPAATPIPGSCVDLLTPADGAELPASGAANFTWTEYPGAFKYIITITRPDGSQHTEIVWTNSYSKDLGLLPAAGTYRWSVTVYDANIQPICTSATFTFTKPESVPATPSGSCVDLLSPADGTELPTSGPVEFTWSEYPGAYKYIITFYPPNTPQVTFLAWTPSHTRYMESFPDAGTYQWTITVKDANIRDICTAGPFTFTKEAGQVQPTVEPGTQPPDAPPGGDLFWNRAGPGGAQASCSGLYFGVSTSVSGMIKVIYSTSGTPDGNVDPHEVIGNGPGSGSGILDFSGYSGQTIYYRFAVYSGVYTHDGSVFSFTCP